MKIKRIIVPVDFTETSFHSIEVASQIAKKNDATVAMIYVVDIPVEQSHADTGMTGNLGNVGMAIEHPQDVSEETGGFNLHLTAEKRERLDGIKASFAGVTYEEHVKPDMYQRHLYKFITNEDADLVVLKTSGHSDPSHSKAADIIRYSPAPVLTLHSQVDEFAPKEIVFASDFRDVPARAIDFLKGIQATYGSKIHLLKIVTPGLFTHSKESYTLMDDFISRAKLENFEKHIFNASDVAEGIVDFAEVVGGDLIIKSTHGRTGIAHWVFGSAAESVAIYAKLPVITLNEHYLK